MEFHSGSDRVPQVSVCIPAYNNEAYILDTINAVLAQTFTDFELVVIDDCSKDKTAAVVEGVKDPRVRLVRNEKNLGMAGNWNRCIEEAGAPFVKVLCADDILYPTSLEREMSALAENPDINLVSSDTALIDLEGRQVGAFKRFPVNGRMNGRRLARISLLFNNFFGAPCNNMFRREAALAVGGFDKNFPYILDFDLWLRLACTGDVYIIHETLNGFRLRNDSNTGEVMGTGEKGDVYVAEHGRLVDKHCSVLGIGKWGCGFSKWWRKTRSKIIHLYLKIKSNA
ncbi:MAG: glycosyltransferase family 2 protein [Lachnospiraceae bacterium]|jgi:glycosyltransferase involved in cell wall biosynthesis|nr:glycosyltransferase family 2 protein [Lachnospiraceae bacterium]